MTNQVDLNELVEKWTLAGFKPTDAARNSAVYSYKNLLDRLIFFSDKIYSRYIPALYPPNTPGFLDRFSQWIGNDGLSDDDMRVLWELASRIAFFSFEDFLQLYRSAFVGPVTRWIIDIEQIKLSSPNFSERIQQERVKNTWYCPITDSMVISEFYHANGISGIDQRPNFRSLSRFGNVDSIKQYMTSQGRNLKRLVLLEDFVGTGTQTMEVVCWAIQNFTCPILFVPLVLGPDGKSRLDKFASQVDKIYPGKLMIKPILVLDKSVFVDSAPPSGEQFHKEVARLAAKLHGKLHTDPLAADLSYGSLGFGQPTDKLRGATVVLFSNTPDNTLPIIHFHRRSNSKWNALFPRVSREI